MKKTFLVFLISVALCGMSYADGTNPYVIGAGVSAGGGSGEISHVASFVGAATNQYTSTVTRAGTTADGDIMFATVTSDTGGGNPCPCSGWTEITSVDEGSVIQSVFYKIASSEGTDTGYEFTCGEVNSNPSAIMMVFSKTGGTWDIQDYNTSSAQNTGATSTTGSVTATADSLLVCGYGNDGPRIVDTAPTDMTGTEVTASSQTAAALYYQESMSAGAVQKTLIWDANDDTTSIAVIIDTVP